MTGRVIGVPNYMGKQSDSVYAKMQWFIDNYDVLKLVKENSFLPATSQAAIPLVPGIYKLADTGQVWQRLADGTLVRRQTLEITPETLASMQSVIDNINTEWSSVQKPAVQAALINMAQSEAERLVRQDTNDLLTTQAIIATQQQAAATAERADTAMADALVMSGVNSQYLSYDGSALPTGAPENSVGAVWDNLGLVRRMKKTINGWVALGAPVLTLTGLKLRIGWNLRDYADLVVNGNWTPAMTQLLADAQPGDTVNIPAGDYRFDGPIVQTKPLTIRGSAARFLINHAGIGWECKPARGTFGFDRQPDGSFLNIVNDIQFPAMLRQRSKSATTQDGSTGVKIWNSVYCVYSFVEVAGFTTGVRLIANRIGTEYVSMVSYCSFRFTALRNTNNLVLDAVKDTPGATNSNGYVSDNSYYDGSFGSYFDAQTGDGGVLLADTHITINGTDRADMQQRNVFHRQTYENRHTYGVVLTGKAWGNIWHQPRFEMPFSTAKVKTAPGCQFNSIFNAYGFGPEFPTALDDQGAYTIITTPNQYYGDARYYNGVWEFTQGETSAQLPAGNLREWHSTRYRNPVALSVLAWTGGTTPLIVDLSKDRSWRVDVSADMPAGMIQVINPPTGRDSKFWLTFIQGSASATGYNIHPDVLTGSLNGLNIPARFQGRDRVEIAVMQVAGAQVYSVTESAPGRGATPRQLQGSAAPTAGAWRQGDTITNAKPALAGDPIAWICTASGTPGTWRVAGRVQPQDLIVSANNNSTHQNTTLQRTFLYDVPLTTNRTVRLYNATASGAGTPMPTGAIVRVVRTAAATGAFTLSATDNAGAVLHEIAVGTWREYQFDGTAWRTIGAGTV